MTGDLHNRSLKAATKRTRDDLEGRMAAVLEPVLNRAADEAARAFEARVTDHLVAAAAGKPPGWSAPVGDEIIDVAALVAKLKTKTDPVRLAAVKALMTKVLEAQGLSWDVTNPFTAKVLAQSASQITHIAQTTQLNVMRIISASYDQGLSIPDTATAIRVGMKAATPARARLIARTELAGAVNGGSLAATQIVSTATGDKYYKVWLTAGGARHPRHELDFGLDGQTVGLDESFAVGGGELDYPGDPAGDPADVCNCRCTLIYTDSLDGTSNEIDPPDDMLGL